MKKFKIDRYFWQILIVGGLVATGLALLIGSWQSIWFDEAYSIQLAKSSWSELIRLTAVDTHPPLYYMVLKLWASLGGYGEIWLRLLSAIFYGGSVVVAGVLIRRLFGTKITLMTLLFLLLAPMLIRYGFEIRGYAMASFIGILATYILVRARENNQWYWWLIYAGLVTIGTLTLYYSVFLWLAHFVWLIWQDVKKPNDLPKRKPWLGAYILSVALFLPWLPNFVLQISSGALAPITQAMTVDNLLGVFTFNIFYKPVWQLDAFWSLMAILTIGFVVWLVVWAYKNLKAKEKSNFNLLLVYALVPIIIITLISLFRPMYVERYLSHVAIGGVMLIAVSASMVLKKQPTTKTHLGVSLLLLAMLTGVVQLAEVGNYNFQRLDKPEVRTMIGQLKIGNEELVIADDPYVMTEINYYLPSEIDVCFFSEIAELKGGYAPWSKSDKRLNPRKVLDASKVRYIYYDEPTVDLTNWGYQPTDYQAFGALKIVGFEK